MKPVTMGSVAVGLATWFAFTVLTALGQTPPGPKPFLVFDGTLYSNKPDLSAYGIRPITIAYAGQFGPDWYKQADRLPDLEAVQAVAREAREKGHMVVLDIEHWPLKGSPDSVRDSLTKYMTVLEWFRAAAPGLSIGYYGVPPIRDYWRAIKDTSSQERRSWMEENDQLRSLAGAVDVLFPSLYTFYPDQAGWKKYAIAQIEEARRYGRRETRICVFIAELSRLEPYTRGAIICRRIIGCLNWRRPKNTPMALSSGVERVNPNGTTVLLGGTSRRNS